MAQLLAGLVAASTPSTSLLLFYGEGALVPMLALCFVACGLGAGTAAFFALRLRLASSLLAMSFAAGVTAVMPYLLLISTSGVPDFASFGGRVVYAGGRLTLAGWLSKAQGFAMIFGMGVIGGSVFWLAAGDRTLAPRRSDQA